MTPARWLWLSRALVAVNACGLGYLLWRTGRGRWW